MVEQFSFKSYGVKIGVRAAAGILKRIEGKIEDIIPGGIESIAAFETEQILDIETGSGGDFKIRKNGEIIAETPNIAAFENTIESQIRLIVAEYAVGKVFLHAGVVSWNDRAVVIPASSFAGKTTLVAALIKKGALYYSDEYAVLDENGSVSPFLKSLSVRGIIDDFTQIERTAETLGGKIGEKSIPIGLVLICKFDKRKRKQKKFAPEILSAGQGMLEILAHTIPIRQNPKFVLKILNTVSSQAVIAKTDRGEAENFADLLIEFLNKTF